MTQERIERIAALAKSAGLDAVAMIPSPNFLWAAGLSKHLSERPCVLVIRADGLAGVIAAGFEIPSIQAVFPEIQPFPFSDNPSRWGEAFAQAGQRLGLTGKTLGVEPRHFRFTEYDFFASNFPNLKMVGAPEFFSTLRLRKSADELAKMRKAARIAEKALEDTLPIVKPGVRELEIANTLIMNLIRRGSSIDLPFEPIVASGPNAADPHAAVSEREVQAGEFVLIDWGARFEGYCSDLTRTFAVGDVSEEMRTVHDTVVAANRAAFAMAKPGVAAGDVDAAARNLIRDRGYGDFFTHRLGHGLGMECHEDPYMFGENRMVLEAGMVFTDEPGIYLPGRFGVRIEDDLVVTETGCESLTSFPRELEVLDAGSGGNPWN